MKMHEAIERAQKADALIYAIGIGDRYTFNVNEGDLKKIAEKTGGRAYFPQHERDLHDAFAQIQRDLREQYLVAYSPSNKARDGSYRRIEIQVVNPDSTAARSQAELPFGLLRQDHHSRAQPPANASRTSKLAHKSAGLAGTCSGSCTLLRLALILVTVTNFSQTCYTLPARECAWAL